jgi:hypothetical protein
MRSLFILCRDSLSAAEVTGDIQDYEMRWEDDFEHSTAKNMGTIGIYLRFVLIWVLSYGRDACNKKRQRNRRIWTNGMQESEITFEVED